MEQRTVAELFDKMIDRQDIDEYNYDHFLRPYAMMDARRTMAGKGIGPGCPVPDFELEDTDGNRIRLGDLRGKPVLLRFGSIS